MFQIYALQHLRICDIFVIKEDIVNSDKTYQRGRRNAANEEFWGVVQKAGRGFD